MINIGYRTFIPYNRLNLQLISIFHTFQCNLTYGFSIILFIRVHFLCWTTSIATKELFARHSLSVSLSLLLPQRSQPFDLWQYNEVFLAFSVYNTFLLWIFDHCSQIREFWTCLRNSEKLSLQNRICIVLWIDRSKKYEIFRIEFQSITWVNT